MSEQTPTLLDQLEIIWKWLSAILTLALTFGVPIWIKRIEKKNSADLEKVKSELDRSLQVQMLQIEREQKIYRDIWGTLVDFRKAVSELRPVIELGVSEEPEEERKTRRLVNLRTIAQCFLDLANRERPFYAEEVYQKFQKLSDLIRTESIDYEMGTPKDGREYWETRRNNLTAIEREIDEILEAIRTRLGQGAGV